MYKVDLENLKTKLEQHEERLDAQSDRMDNIEEMVLSDRQQTIMLLADHCKRHDYHSNMAKLRCVLITGLISN